MVPGPTWHKGRLPTCSNIHLNRGCCVWISSSIPGLSPMASPAGPSALWCWLTALLLFGQPQALSPNLQICSDPCDSMSELDFQSFSFSSAFLKILIKFWLCRVFTAMCGVSLVGESGGYSLLQCTGFSVQRLLLLWSAGFRWSLASVVVVYRLQSTGPVAGWWAQLLHGMWDVHRPAVKPLFPALAGGFLSTVPLGKSFEVSLRQGLQT